MRADQGSPREVCVVRSMTCSEQSGALGGAETRHGKNREPVTVGRVSGRKRPERVTHGRADFPHRRGA